MCLLAGKPAKNVALLSQWTSSTADIPYPSFSAGWTAPVFTVTSIAVIPTSGCLLPGCMRKTIPVLLFMTRAHRFEPSYYADADGVVRRAAGAYVPSGGTASASTTRGIASSEHPGIYRRSQSSLVTPASATPFTQSQSRPLLLHRPFRTVAELGYVFRDLPWKEPRLLHTGERGRRLARYLLH